MMRNVLAVAAAALTTAGASTARAQAVGAPMLRPFTFGVAGGAAFPTGKTGDVADTGFDLTGLVEYKVPLVPVGFRAELMYNRYGIKDLPSSYDGHHRVLAGIVNVVATAPSAGVVAPYVIAGPGVYNVRSTLSQGGVDASVSKTAMGLNGGVGLQLKLIALSAFAEARYHYVFSKDADKGMENSQAIPVTIGFKF